MFCPVCRDEFVDGIVRCKACDTALVDVLPAESTPTLRDLVPVFATGELAELINAKGLLEAADISFVTTNEGLQDLFAAGRIGGFNPVIGEVQILVDRESLARATEVLDELSHDANDG